MIKRFLLGFGVLAVLLAGAWVALRPPSLPESTAVPAPVPAALGEVAGGDGPVGTAAGRPGMQPPSPFAVKRAVAVPATLFNDYLKARDYRAIYDRLDGSAEGGTAEGKLVLHEILRACATVTGARRMGFRQNTPSREAFLAALPASDPQRDRRIAAYEEFTTNRCKGFEGVTITQAALDKLLQESAEAGDPRARAMAIEQELWASRRAVGRNSATITDAQIESLKDVLATKDPEAMRVAGRVLSNSWADYGLRFGPDQAAVEPRPFMNAWLVLACEYGQPCGSDTPRMQQACALRGHCDAMTFPDYLHYYGSTPHDSQVLLQYRAWLRQAIETGDWSQLSVVRGAGAGTNRVTFVPGPR
jgi:hypothetical protein